MSSSIQQIETNSSSLQSNIGGSAILNSMMPTFYISLIAVGIILLFATVGSTSMDSLNGSIAGYSFIAGGIILLVSFLFYGIFANRNEPLLSKNNRYTLLSLIYTTGPFFLVLGIIGYSMYLLITYKTRISEGNVAPGYVSFTNISIILILMQLFLFYLGSQKDGFKKTNRLDRVYSMLLYFVGIINIVAVITLGIILAYFSTDG
jgi:hypothetical protein